MGALLLPISRHLKLRVSGASFDWNILPDMQPGGCHIIMTKIGGHLYEDDRT